MLAHAMSASPLLSTATDGGALENGVPTLTALPAASAFAHSATATIVASPHVRHARRTAAACRGSRPIPHPLLFDPV